MSASYVVTGGGRGIGRAVVERLLRAETADSTAAVVVPVELDPAVLDWTAKHPAADRIVPVIGATVTLVRCGRTSSLVRMRTGRALSSWAT
jgi:NAD(P)-dependent dehydrogenase (short-subunit alcohol dehydrogenase family)